MPRFEAAGDVDGVDAGAGANDQRQRAGIHHRVGDLGRPDDQDRRLRLLDRGDQRVAGRLGLKDHVTARGLQARRGRTVRTCLRLVPS